MNVDNSNPAGGDSTKSHPDRSRTERRAEEVESRHRRHRRTALVLAPLLLIAAVGTGVALTRNGDDGANGAGAQAGKAAGQNDEPDGKAPTGSQPPGATPGAASPTTSCPKVTPVTLWAPQALTPTLAKAAAEFAATDAASCVSYQVAAKNPTETLAGLGKSSGRPDAWVTDASVWVDQVNAADRGNDKVKNGTPFATSPLVVAMGPQRAATFSTAPTWPQLVAPGSPLTLTDPVATTAGMLTISSALPRLSVKQGRAAIPHLEKALAPSTDKLFEAYDARPTTAAAFPVSEASLVAHNQAKPSRRMVSVAPRGGTLSFEYSLVPISKDTSRAKAVAALGTWLQGAQAAGTLTAGGFRATGGSQPAPSIQGAVGTISAGPGPTSKQFAAAVDTWQAAVVDFSLLIAFDVSGSMKENIGPGSRAQVTQKAAAIGLRAMPTSTRLGLWIFSSDIGPKGVDYREIVPLGPLSSATHRARVAMATQSLTEEVGGGTGLYDTIWAGYQKALSTYDPTRLNALVIITDGRNEKPSGLTLAQLKSKLKAAADPKRPVAVTTIGIGPRVDVGPLREISRMTSSDYWGAPTAADITTVLSKALFDHTCSNGACV